MLPPPPPPWRDVVKFYAVWGSMVAIGAVCTGGIIWLIAALLTG
ncbi:hypothetical protein GCM10017673_37550 [Streptosporangium violaceochromogenes]|nr:hypothetical protein GCM10017673_37550 [Streptosporangium violaceochromogenes]